MKMAGTLLSEGDPNPVAIGVAAALRGEGFLPAPPGAVADVLLLSAPLVLQVDAPPPADLVGAARRAAEAGCGRILCLLPVVAGLPARRFPEQSAHGAAILAGLRGLAMTFGGRARVNALGVGAITGDDGELVAGDAGLLRHVPGHRAGSVAEVAAAALFLCDPANGYTTGQFLAVDGGWTAGYGRNF
ncbi:MAG: SDR family oxidoreductase [Amaricoccus sp.]